MHKQKEKNYTEKFIKHKQIKEDILRLKFKAHGSRCRVTRYDVGLNSSVFADSHNMEKIVGKCHVDTVRSSTAAQHLQLL